MIREAAEQSARILLAGAGVLAAATSALAQNAPVGPLVAPEASEAPPAPTTRWIFRPFLSVREAFTDNVLLTSNGRRSDFLTTFSPGVSVSGEGGRVRLDFDYALSYDLYARTSSLNGLRQNFAGKGNAELLRQSLFIDVSAFAGQDYVSSTGPASAIDRRLGTNSTQYYTYALSPYWTARYGNWASSTLRYRFAQYFSHDDSAAETTFGPPLQDSTLNEVTGSVVSGERFQTFTWDTQAAFRDTKSSGAGSRFRAYNVFFNGVYHLNQTYAALATVGYERTDSGDFSSAVEGPVWTVGLRYTPNERLTASLSYGRRFDGPYWSGDLYYRIGPQTTFVASYTETITTQQQLALDNLGFITRNPVSGQLVDSRTGLPFVGRDPTFDQNNQAFIQRQFSASLQAIRGRNTYVITAFYTTRDSDIGGAGATNVDETSVGGTGLYTRAVSRVTDASARVSYYRNSNSAGGSNRTFRADASVQYRMNESLTGTAGYAFINRSAEGTQVFVNDFVGSFRENVVFVSLRKAF